MKKVVKGKSFDHFTVFTRLRTSYTGQVVLFQHTVKEQEVLVLKLESNLVKFAITGREYVRYDLTFKAVYHLQRDFFPVLR